MHGHNYQLSGVHEILLGRIPETGFEKQLSECEASGEECLRIPRIQICEQRGTLEENVLRAIVYVSHFKIFTLYFDKSY